MLYLYLEEFGGIYFTRNFTNIENTWLTDDSVNKLRNTINPFHLQYRKLSYINYYTTNVTLTLKEDTERINLILALRVDLHLSIATEIFATHFHDCARKSVSA